MGPVMRLGFIRITEGNYSCTSLLTYTHTHTHPFNGPLSGTTRVSRYQKGKTDLDFTEARDCEWQWHQLGRMQVCTSLQTDNHASTPPLSIFTGRMPFLPPNQQRQSTEGNTCLLTCWLYPLKFGERAFSVTGPADWPRLPADIETTIHLHHSIQEDT